MQEEYIPISSMEVILVSRKGFRSLSSAKMQYSREDCHFLIEGDRVEYPSTVKLYEEAMPANVALLKYLQNGDYDNLVCPCDVGLIYLCSLP